MAGLSGQLDDPADAVPGRGGGTGWGDDLDKILSGRGHGNPFPAVVFEKCGLLWLLS